MRIEVPVTAPQGEFLASTAEYTLFCAGVGSGKTRAGAYWAAREAMTAPGTGFIGANTYQQLNRVTLKAFLQVLADWRVPFVFGKRPPAAWGLSVFPNHESVCSIYVRRKLRQIICAQLGVFDYLRGLEIRWFWIDETRDTPEEAFDVLLARKRGGPAGARRPGAVTTTPDGFNWLYERFVAGGEKALADRKVTYASSRSNPWLPQGYVEGLLASYSARLAEQEIEGKFVSLTSGMAFAEFSRVEHVSARVSYSPYLDLIHSLDFNVNPLCSVILQPQPNGEVWCIDEIHVTGSARTWDATDAFLARYREHPGRVLVYGDRSGRSRSTRSETCDFDLIEQAYRPVFGDRLAMRPNLRNPPVHSSVQDVNSMLRAADGRVRLRFAPRCEYTIRDMEQVAFRPGTRELDKTDPGLTHHADALRYYISAEHPANRHAVRAGGGTPDHW